MALLHRRVRNARKPLPAFERPILPWAFVPLQGPIAPLAAPSPDATGDPCDESQEIRITSRKRCLGKPPPSTTGVATRVTRRPVDKLPVAALHSIPPWILRETDKRLPDTPSSLSGETLRNRLASSLMP